MSLRFGFRWRVVAVPGLASTAKSTWRMKKGAGLHVRRAEQAEGAALRVVGGLR
jgi:hypothetical protein